MPGFWKIFLPRTPGSIRDTLDVHKQSILLISEYNAWSIVHYHYWNKLAAIFFNIVFIALLLYGTRKIRKWFKHKCRYTETIPQQNCQMISIKHGVDVIHYFPHHIMANKSMNTQFINGAKMLDMLLGFADCLYLASGWNWIPMSFGSICDVQQRWNEMLASCESKLGFERQYDIFGWKKGSATRTRRVWGWEVWCGNEQCTKGVGEA